MIFYIDKNILFNYANNKLFNEREFKYDIDLVELIKTGEINIIIHEATIFSLINYLSFKLERPLYKHGKNLSPEVADKTSREFCFNIFKKANWQVISLDKKEITSALKDMDFNYEDSVQYYSFIKSKAEYFITWNKKDFIKVGKKLLNPKDFFNLKGK